MPEPDTKTETVVEVQTSMAKSLQQATDAAMKAATGGLSDPDFDKSIQEAIDKDAGKKPAETTADTTDKATGGDANTPGNPGDKTKETTAKTDDGIPPELLGEKKPEAKVETVKEPSEEERNKALEEQTKGLSPAARTNFQKLEKRAHEAERTAKKHSEEVATLRQQIADLQKKTTEAPKPDTTELERLRKERDDLDAIVQKQALQDHPKFKQHYDGRISEEIAQAKKIVPTEAADEMEQLLTLPESKKRNERIMEIAETLNDIQKVKLLNTVADIDKLASAKLKELNNWKENKIHLEADAVRNQQVEAARMKDIQEVAWSKGLQAVTSPELGLFVFQKVEGNDDWNKQVEERINKTKTILHDPNLAPEKLVEIAARAVAADDFRKLFLGQRALIRKLQEENAALKTAEPSADTGGATGGDAEEPKSFMDAVDRNARAAGAVR